MSSFLETEQDRAACGVGFLATRNGKPQHKTLQKGLRALAALEHRGAVAADGISADGSGIMTDIPHKLLGTEPGRHAVATVFFQKKHADKGRRLICRELQRANLPYQIRTVPLNHEQLGSIAAAALPVIEQFSIDFEKQTEGQRLDDQTIYLVQRNLKTKLAKKNMLGNVHFVSFSFRTIIYKALCTADRLADLYPDLKNPQYQTRFALFHRRFSTNTAGTWDKAQPFRIIAHNGEINTIAGNRSWAFSREQSLHLPAGDLLTRGNISDSGSLNEMVEALIHRTGLERPSAALAVTMPPAQAKGPFYSYWQRAMEPWDGPAMVAFCNGHEIGARLDRNGFRPARWVLTEDWLGLASESGTFGLKETEILQRGSLAAGSGVHMNLETGAFSTGSCADPGYTKVVMAPNETQLPPNSPPDAPQHLYLQALFDYSQEDLQLILTPMIEEGKEGIGSMGDTARPAFLSDLPRSFFDYFYQNFAQVTNPPLDYMREAMVTDLKTYLGRKPNIFKDSPGGKPWEGMVLDSPVLSLADYRWFAENQGPSDGSRPGVRILNTTFPADQPIDGLQDCLRELGKQAVSAARAGFEIIVLSDADATTEQPAAPTLLALRAVVNALNAEGLRLHSSVVVHGGDVRETHHLAALISFGAAAVCPYLSLEIARFDPPRAVKISSADLREANLIQAFEQGLLKIMAKMGISVVRSYQSSKLFTIMGLSPEFCREFFPGTAFVPGRTQFDQLAEDVVRRIRFQKKPSHHYLYREQRKGTIGEKHTTTNQSAKLVHALVSNFPTEDEETAAYRAWLDYRREKGHLTPRDLFTFKPMRPEKTTSTEPLSAILARFGSAAMSFGALSAESQRDLFLAMKQIGGRANSGEGGDNPLFAGAQTKQIASGRFGVTADYLRGAEEFQIKMAQGAKPGEGGQLPGFKVDENIAKARCTKPGRALISPPPQHDIYSIEDLKELIYELKQFQPESKVSVKLVAGNGIGTIAVGVAKAGADIIHLSGGDGGTGAATLGSMKHAGLPWEPALLEIHHHLKANGLRNRVVLRVDGGLNDGRDIIAATMMGAEEFDFGKILLVAEGCVMARICQKNTCPVGIATQNPKFKQKYKGNPEKVAAFLTHIAAHTRRILKQLNASSLKDLLGRTDLLAASETKGRASRFAMDLLAYQEQETPNIPQTLGQPISRNPLNQRILNNFKETPAHSLLGTYRIRNTDRGVPAALFAQEPTNTTPHFTNADISKHPGPSHTELRFLGHAGQGFGAFCHQGFKLRLWGTANDGVGKSMSGGSITITPSRKSTIPSEKQTIIGNCALYGACGGTLFVRGRAGDRFAVRNSGTLAVVEGVGLHGCEYMTGGTVIILGRAGQNLGAGMTGGEIFVLDQQSNYHADYLEEAGIGSEEEKRLRKILRRFHGQTGSQIAARLLEKHDLFTRFTRLVPIGESRQNQEPKTPSQTAIG